MASKYGAIRGEPQYDRFRTGLTFAEAKRMLHVGGEDPSRWRYHRRGTVLGFLHQLKLELWRRANPDTRL